MPKTKVTITALTVALPQLHRLQTAMSRFFSGARAAAAVGWMLRIWAW